MLLIKAFENNDSRLALCFTCTRIDWMINQKVYVRDMITDINHNNIKQRKSKTIYLLLTNVMVFVSLDTYLLIYSLNFYDSHYENLKK